MSDDFDFFYKKFLSSHLWKKMRLEFIEGNHNTDPDRSCDNPLFCYTCDHCGWNWPTEDMQVHHKHYHKPFGKETRKDVLVVCKDCHQKMDVIRARQGRERSQAALASARYDSGFETWITKRYGEDAIHDYWDSEVEQEKFQQFIERNEDRDW